MICLLLGTYNIVDIFKENRLKAKYDKLHASEKYLSGDNLAFITIFAALSGFIGQIFAVGGGFIYGPMLLMLGVNPLVSSSTCLYMILFTNGVSFFQFAIYGQVNFSFVLALSPFNISGVILGMCLIKTIMKKYKRPSLIAFSLGAIICLAATITIVSSS